MIPSFRYLQIDATEEKLKELEKITGMKMNIERVAHLVKEIQSETEIIFGLLAEEILRLQQLNGEPSSTNDITTASINT